MRPGSNEKASSSGPFTVVHGDLEEGEDAPVVVELSEGAYARMEAEDDEGDAAATATETSAADEAPPERMGWMMG